VVRAEVAMVSAALRPRAARVLAAALATAYVVLHEWVSDLSRLLEDRLGFAALDRGALIAISAACALGLLGLGLRRVRWPGRGPLAALIVLAAATWLAHRYLIVNNIEIIHFPQYAILTAALIGGGLSPRGAWLAAVAIGVVDEAAQVALGLALRPELTYLDTNDMLLDAIGATWAVVLLEGFGRPRASAPGSSAGLRTIVLATVGVGGVLALVAPPGWVVRHGAFERAYVVLSASLGFAAAVGLYAVVVAARPRSARSAMLPP
jgi:hypothetical protein